MATNHTGNIVPDIAQEEHDSKNLSVKKVGLTAYNSDTDEYVRVGIDADGNLNTTQQLSITQSIDVTAYDLNAAAYSQAVTPDFDYIIDNFQLEFSAAESRTITLTSDNGTKIYEATNSNLTVALGSINFGQESGDSFTLAITQTSGACTVDVALYIKNSPVALTADPVIAAGTNSIGSVAMEEGLAISKGDISGTTYVHKFGKAPDFDSGDGFVAVWDGANDAGVDAMQYTFSTTADIDSLSSDNAGDTQDIEVQGLDTNFDLVVQTITLTGQTPVALTTDLIRVFRLKNVGTTNNAGRIFCYVSGNTVTAGVPQTSADIRAIIQPGNNQTLMAVYTVPNGKTGYLREWYISLNNNVATTVDAELRARPFGQVLQLKNTVAIGSSGTSTYNHKYVEPERFAAKTDIIMKASTAGTSVSVAAGFDIVLVDN